LSGVDQLFKRLVVLGYFPHSLHCTIWDISRTLLG
jgi:hypothetical protein